MVVYFVVFLFYYNYWLYMGFRNLKGESIKGFLQEVGDIIFVNFEKVYGLVFL